MLDKHVLEIWKLLETKDIISYEEFKELYLKFYASFLGLLKSNKYQDKKEILDLAYLLVNIKVITKNKKEENDIKRKKEEIINTMNNLENKSKRR